MITTESNFAEEVLVKSNPYLFISNKLGLTYEESCLLYDYAFNCYKVIREGDENISLEDHPFMECITVKIDKFTLDYIITLLYDRWHTCLSPEY